tara:strand:+ start:205 stop:420 length:216 start_codon:yes stop_codon:yes gene_type:complete
MENILFNVKQFKESPDSQTKVTKLAHNVGFEKAKEVYKKYSHRDGYVIGNTLSYIEIEVSEKSKKDFLKGE